MLNKIFMICQDNFLIEKIKEKIICSCADKLCGFETLPVFCNKRISGYRIKTFNGEEFMLASMEILSDLSFNKYAVSSTALRAAAASFPSPGKIIFIKGLGPMFLKFDCFMEKLISAISADFPMIILSSCRNSIKSISSCIDNVFVIEVSNENFFSVCRDMQREIENLKRRLE